MLGVGVALRRGEGLADSLESKNAFFRFFGHFVQFRHFLAGLSKFWQDRPSFGRIIQVFGLKTPSVVLLRWPRLTAWLLRLTP